VTQDFALLMLSAMYENGGNTTHRLLDGHPEMFVYPFESQLGTNLVHDRLSSLYPVKYRWPVFPLDAAPAEDYAAMIDEETRVRARTPDRSKFRAAAFEFSDEERRSCYTRHVAATGRSRGNNVAAFFRATFEAWRNHSRTGHERWYVGYSPIIVVDADKILHDFPNSHILHVVRNPASAYADTKKRPVPLSLRDYMLGWTVAQHHAVTFQRLHPERVHVVRFEDLVVDPIKALERVCVALGVEPTESLRVPTWNGTVLDEIYPWGTIRRATAAENLATAAELSETERAEVKLWAGHFIDTFEYRGIV
jgi:hypothetical protein